MRRLLTFDRLGDERPFLDGVPRVETEKHMIETTQKPQEGGEACAAVGNRGYSLGRASRATWCNAQRPLSPRRSSSECIIITRGYDFREGQRNFNNGVSRRDGTASLDAPRSQVPAFPRQD